MITLFLKPRYYQSTAEAPLAGGIVAHSYHDKPSISPTKSLKETGAHSEALAFSSSITNLLSVHLHPHIHSMDLWKFLLTVLLLSLLNYASYAAKSWEEDNFLKTCPPYRCNKHHEPEIRFPFRLSTHPPPCSATGMELSCSDLDAILNHPVLGPAKWPQYTTSILSWTSSHWWPHHHAAVTESHTLNRFKCANYHLNG